MRKAKFCETKNCFNTIPNTVNRRFCDDCVKERIRLRGKLQTRKKPKPKKRVHDKCLICGHKLAKCNCTGYCFHHDSYAPLHGRRTHYIKELR